MSDTPTPQRFTPTPGEMLDAMYAAYPEQFELVAQRLRSQLMAAYIAERDVRVAELEAFLPTANGDTDLGPDVVPTDASKPQTTSGPTPEATS